jgi:hypothetical protein
MAKAKKIGYAAYRLSPLKKITDLAKQIRKKNPNMKYLDAVKKAGAEYRKGKTAKPSPVKRKAAAKKKAPVRKAAVKKTAKKRTAPAVKQGALFGRNGISGKAMDQIKDMQNDVMAMEAQNAVYKKYKLQEKKTSEKMVWSRKIKLNSDYITTLKKQIQSLKKHIK